MATTTPPSGISQTGAILDGTVNPNGVNTSCYFEWGTTTSYGNQTSSQNVESGSGNVNVNFTLTGLTPGTTYYYRLVCSNSYGTSYGADRSFTTGATFQVSLTGVSAVGDTTGQTAQVSGLPISGPEVPVQ